jgi:hypothetical protein
MSETSPPLPSSGDPPPPSEDAAAPAALPQDDSSDQPVALAPKPDVALPKLGETVVIPDGSAASTVLSGPTEEVHGSPSSEATEAPPGKIPLDVPIVSPADLAAAALAAEEKAAAEKAAAEKLPADQAQADAARIEEEEAAAAKARVNARNEAAIAAALARTLAQHAASAAHDGRTSQGSMLLMAPIIDADHEKQLRALLAEIARPSDGTDLEVNEHVPFLRLRTVHFARFVIHAASPSEDAPIPVWNGVPQASGPPIPAKLLFSTDYDGPRDAHVSELLREAGPGLDAVFSHCEGWPGLGRREDVDHFFMRWDVPTTTFYTGTMSRSVEQIRREADLHERVERFLDREAGKPAFPSDPVQARERIRDFVRSEPALAWARVEPGPFPKLLIPQRFVDNLPKTAGVLAAGLLVAAVVVVSRFVGWGAAFADVGGVVLALAVVAGAAYAYLSYLAARDPVIIRDTVKGHTAELVRTEDRIVQNEMSSVIYVKSPLPFRHAVLWTVLKFINFAARYLSNQGTLSGIPSIHFARWVIVDDGRRLLFFSNFDGSWDNYLGDFIDKAHDGLTGVWSNCVGFPRTKGLTGDGATDEQAFKAYSRDSQIPTQVWFSAYKWLSVNNINNNSRIRLGLYGVMDPAQAQAWLRRF